MKVFDTVAAFREWRVGLDREAGGARRRIGFVPTMGALHAGHASLLEQARRENDFVVLSVFVNPTQFDRADDLENYPRTFDEDLRIAAQHGVGAVFAPRDAGELYPDDSRYRVTENQFSKLLCGAHRPGHFEGVLTVVMKLLNLVRADSAYFGEKDYQQLTLIRGMSEAFFLETKIVACPTVREGDGLAMSSRNTRLSPRERILAPRMHEAMEEEPDVQGARMKLEREGFRVDYLEDRPVPGDGFRRFAAAYLGDVRLIDNIPLDSPPSEER